MCLCSCINILFYSQVFTCCIVDCATIFNSCCNSWSCSIISYSTTICSCIRFESITACNLVSQIGQIDLSFCTSYASTCTIIVFQCYRFSCSIIFIAFSCTTSTLVYSFACTTRCSWTNMQFVRFQCISCRFQIRYVNCCIWSCSVSII